jgi:predicted dehydrogenase
MSKDYVNVLKALYKEEFLVVGRSEGGAKAFQQDMSVDVVAGGLDLFLRSSPKIPDMVIVAVSVEELAPVTSKLLNYGVKRILLEKPGGLDSAEISKISEKSLSSKSDVYVAYNRRFYSSVATAKKLIDQDGGVSSFNFELTEWSHAIDPSKKSDSTMKAWFLANTSHVVDMAFYLGGKPEKLSAYSSGGLSWHPSGSKYSGSGETTEGALFSYFGDWEAPGRWAVEISTSKHRYFFRPLEQLWVQKKGSIQIEQYDLNDGIDKEFKPGLYRQVEAFINNDTLALCAISDQLSMAVLCENMAGYN